MSRLTSAKLIVFALMAGSGSMAGAVDVNASYVSDVARRVQQGLDPDSETAIAASEVVALAANPPPSVAVPIPNYGHLLLHDTRYVLTSPARWDRRDWRDAGLMGLAVLGTAALVDRPIQNAMQRSKNRTSDNITRFFEPFGAQYSLVVLGGFYFAGSVNDDPKAKAVAQDGLAASLIAAGVITPVLKLVVGRSRPNQDGGAHRFRPFGSNASFPSGHTTQAFAVASVVASHYESPWVKTAAYGVASLVGYARVYHNAHFASDVLAGAAIGSLVGTSLVGVNEKLRSSGMSLVPVAVHKGAGFALTKEF